MERRKFLTLLAAAASIAVPIRSLGGVGSDPAHPKEEGVVKPAQGIGCAVPDSVTMPSRIVDLHTHLFNSKYLPLEGIINDFLGTRNNLFAHLAAELLYELTDSAYETLSNQHSKRPQRDINGQFEAPKSVDDYYVNEIWETARFEVLHAARALQPLSNVVQPNVLNKNVGELPGLSESYLVEIISKLSGVTYEKEWTNILPNPIPGDLNMQTLKGLTLRDFLSKSKNVVTNTVWILIRIVLPKFVSEPLESYGEFLFLILQSEKKIASSLVDGYGDGLPPIQSVHYLMDMQMAYPGQHSPRYKFYTQQLDEMSKLLRLNPGRLFGFSAFDPRRKTGKKLQSIQ